MVPFPLIIQVYSVVHQSVCQTESHLKTIMVSSVKDESAREPERFITHQTLLGKFRSLILSFWAVGYSQRFNIVIPETDVSSVTDVQMGSNSSRREMVSAAPVNGVMLLVKQIFFFYNSW